MVYKKIDRKAYQYFVFNPQTGKIVSGWEYREDAKEYIKQTDQNQLKVYTRAWLKRKDCDPQRNSSWGTDNLRGVKYKPEPEVVLYGNFRKDVQIPEIKVRYNKGKSFKQIRSSRDVVGFLRRVYGRQISIQEHFVLLLTDNNLNVIGYYKHTVGTPVSTLADIPMLMGIVLKSMARSFVISHNHPSGNTMPSQADRNMTVQVQKAARTVGLKLLDHIIVTKHDHYSFADSDGLSGVAKNGKQSLEQQLRQQIMDQLKQVNNNPELTPNVFKLIQTQSGYQWMEKRMIRMMITDRITASATIPQIENEL